MDPGSRILASTCIVTAGPAFEPLDQVRRLTNFSSGALGTELAEHLAAQGWPVQLLRSQTATFRPPRTTVGPLETVEFTTTDALSNLLLNHFQPADVAAVFHAAAVSDFQFGQLWQRHPEGLQPIDSGGKIPSHLHDLLVELVPAKKILPSLRARYPEAFLCGWKYEVTGDAEQAIGRGLEQCARCHTNCSVVNGPAYPQGFALVHSSQRLHCASKRDLFLNLQARLKHHLERAQS